MAEAALTQTSGSGRWTDEGALLTGGQPWSGPGRLHLLARVGQHVVALGFVDQVATRLRGLDQLLVVHHVQQVRRVDERKAHHRQQLRQVLRRREEKRERMKPKNRERSCNLPDTAD